MIARLDSFNGKITEQGEGWMVFIAKSPSISICGNRREPRRFGVARIFNLPYRILRAARVLDQRRNFGRLADNKSAIRQSATLRYVGCGCAALRRIADLPSAAA